MALDLTLLGVTGVEAVTKLINYTLSTSIQSKWINVVGTGSPYLPAFNATVTSVTTPDSAGDVPIYTGSQSITYNRVGFQKAFQGLNLVYTSLGPYKVSDVVAGLMATYGILLEPADLQQGFSTVLIPDELGYVYLYSGTASLRFYIDYSPFIIKVKINTNTLTDLQKLIANQKLADLGALNAANTPATRGSTLLGDSIDSAP
jgi:hypothetical protein